MKTLIIGGAGFIGSVLVKKILQDNADIIVIDKLSLGSTDYIDTNKVAFYQIDINQTDQVLDILQGKAIGEVWHLAANSDIPGGVEDINVDLKDTFMSTVSTLKIMKEIGCKKLCFASSSAVYGFNENILHEDIGPLMPISNYGAMKLASEGLISASLETFLDKVCIYRFPNVVGVPATHGVILDFIRKLKKDMFKLEVLGNGFQQKTYMHVSELVEAMLFINSNTDNGMNYFNIGAMDDGVFVKQIAEETIKVLSPDAKINYQKTDRGWVGDVPRFYYSVDKLKDLGWSPKMSSLEAIQKAVSEIVSQEVK
ncbi:NAD-dependent epimerase/dehydratase family protein [Alphaproteobacteria bacterium]|nr:NAD-dependent epimerase/dehydratase family protein [Alphaproteobacteria bacterium]